MAKPSTSRPDLDLPAHGASILPSVTVDSYNVEIEDKDGFVGDKASKAAFWSMVDRWRERADLGGDDNLGKKSSQEIGKESLADLLGNGDAKVASIVHSAVEEFAQELTAVIRRYLRLKEWRGTECVFVGGGFSASRLGELAAARAELLLRASGEDLDIEMIRNDPDEAALLGGVHLLPQWMLKGHKGILAVDIGGTNFRAGVVKFGRNLVTARARKLVLWRHGDEEISRDDAVARLVNMLEKLIRWARRNRIELAPVIAIACPGLIGEDGSILRGGQNLPGNWESRHFNLPAAIRKAIPKIGKGETFVVMHNDAVVQGLSELGAAKARKSWGVLTIGTGLGNARFTNRKSNDGGG